MKILLPKGVLYGSLLLLGFVLINAAGYLFHLKYISVFAAAAEIDKYEIRSRLLMEAMDEVGVCSPEDAARVWANGLKKRSAAMQYSVMTKKLKAEYEKQLEATFPNWVTGVSSPWIEKYEIIQTEKIDINNYSFLIRFFTATSAGPAGNYGVYLIVARDGEFWRIARIAADRELSVYTGLQP